ncbi:hypothetical protein IFM89_029615 [Coptis chinensis]|uniref:Ubiquitin-like domain-containing protein n=1 Tax=Coptis chinensis TaxID=261450 RepID=A0A835MA74_9MAGN|nr:hypothetical protein IFM89_029615 [Coptis chinensis]
MAIHNVLVKLLDGKTTTLKFTNPTISGSSIKTQLQSLTQIPSQHQRLITGTKQIHDQTLITIPNNESFITVNLLLRLVGGKGGFGSLLRGAATKAGQKKTNNFDACRDMSGRRLRHVNAEKKLEEWKAEAEERKLEKIAEDFIKKKAKAVKKNGGNGESEKYIAKYREDSEKCMDVVEASVRESLGRLEDAKRKILPSAGKSGSKRLKLWMSKEEESDEDEDEEEEEEEEAVVLDGVMNCEMRSKDGEGCSRSVYDVLSEGESSGGGSMESNLEEENGNGGSFEVGEGSGNGEIHDEGSGLAEPSSVKRVSAVEESVPLDVESGVSEETVDQNVSDCTTEVVDKSESSDNVTEANGSIENIAVENGDNTNTDKPLDFNDYNTAREMEVLGMERLKAELQARGLKCGGTLPERAARLFLLKTTPLEMLPKKLLAKK